MSALHLRLVPTVPRRPRKSVIAVLNRFSRGIKASKMSARCPEYALPRNTTLPSPMVLFSMCSTVHRHINQTEVMYINVYMCFFLYAFFFNRQKKTGSLTLRSSDCHVQTTLIFENTCYTDSLNYSSKKVIITTDLFFFFHIIWSIKLF